MDDFKIIELYWERAESAIYETQKKYDGYCYSIANNILSDIEDAHECVNDTYLAAWNAIPPNRPKQLSTFLGKITRRISIDRLRKLGALKRGGATVILALEELQDCIPDQADPAAMVEAKELAITINQFLERLSYMERMVFLMRYFELASLQDISVKFQITTGKTKSMLHRTRVKLRTYLQREGY